MLAKKDAGQADSPFLEMPKLHIPANMQAVFLADREPR